MRKLTNFYVKIFRLFSVVIALMFLKVVKNFELQVKMLFRVCQLLIFSKFKDIFWIFSRYFMSFIKQQTFYKYICCAINKETFFRALVFIKFHYRHIWREANCSLHKNNDELSCAMCRRWYKIYLCNLLIISWIMLLKSREKHQHIRNSSVFMSRACN